MYNFMIQSQAEYNQSSKDKQHQQQAQERTDNMVILGSEKSQYLPAYLSYLPECPNLTYDGFAQNSIIYYPKTSSSTKEWFLLQKGFQFNHAEVLGFRVKLSAFEVKVSLFNAQGPNPFLTCSQYKTGKYGQVYHYQFLSNPIAIKVFPYGCRMHSSTIIKAAIKQYAILKICSALGCGPNVESNFGFDLIAYEDSVMFCMEECFPIYHLSEQNINSLKSDLRMMHQFRIIHFDIKPGNVMFSPYFRKHVFIDFGFSQVITEDLGFKTLVQFRGSPGYCSREMTDLLGEYSSDILIDVYYNDYHALRQTVIQLQGAQQLYLAEQSDQQGVAASSDEDSQFDGEVTQNRLLLILLKYKLVSKEKTGVVQLLNVKQCMLLKAYGRVVLDYSRKLLPEALFEGVYRELKREFHNFVQPTVMEGYFRYNYRHCLYPTGGNEKSNIQATVSDYKHRITGNYTEGELTSYGKYQQFLEIKGVFMNESTAERAKTILIECLRFDLKNLEIADKIRLANRFNYVFGVKYGQNLDSIKATFQYLLEYCISSPITLWKKEKIFIVLSQFLMLDLNLEPYFDIIIACLTKMNQSFKEKISCWMKIANIMFMQQFKYKSDHQCMIQEIQIKMDDFGRQMLFNALKQYEKSNDEDARHIFAALDIFLQPKDPTKASFYFHQLNAHLKELTCDAFQECLAQISYLALLEFCYMEHMYQQISNFYEIIKESSFLHILQEKTNVFSLFTFHVYQIFVITKDHRQVVRLLDNVIKVINCPAVSSKYKFQMCIFLFSDETNSQKLHQFVMEVLGFLPGLRSQKLKYEFPMLIHKMKKDQTFCKVYPQYFETFLINFLKCEEETKSQVGLIITTQIEDITQRYSILRQFSGMRLNTSGQLLMRAIDAQKKRIVKNNLNSIPILQRLNYNLLLQIEYQHRSLPLKRLEALQQIYHICTELKNQKLLSYILKIIIRCTALEETEDKLLHYALVLYNFSHTIPSYTRYFYTGLSLIFLTLYQFQRRQKMDQFYHFLHMLAKFLTKFPSKEAILELNQNIDIFMKIGRYGHLFTYQALSSQINDICWDNHYYVCYYAYSLQVEQNNAILIKILIEIAQNICFLTTHAKEIILPIFFRSIMSYFKPMRRKFMYLTLRWGYRYLPRHQFLLNARLNQVKLKSNEIFSGNIPKKCMKIKALKNLRLCSNGR